MTLWIIGCCRHPSDNGGVEFEVEVADVMRKTEVQK